LVPCGRLSWLLVSFWAHVNIVHRIVSYRLDVRLCAIELDMIILTTVKP